MFLKSSFKKISISAYSVYALDENLSIEEKSGVILNFIREFIKENRIGSVDIYMGIPDELVIFREIEFPATVKENLRATLSYEIDKYVPLTSDQLCFDYQILSEIKETNRIKLLVGIGKKDELSQYIELAKSIPNGVSGIESITTAIANGMAFINNGNGRQPNEPISHLLTKANLSALKEHPLPIDQYGIPTIDLVPSFGLALKGIRDVPFQINFLPLEIRKKPGKGAYYAMMILTVLMVITGIAWMTSHILHQRMVRNRLDVSIEQLTPEIKKIEQIRNDTIGVDSNLEFFKTFNTRKQAIDILSELSKILPDTAWVYELYLSDNSIQINGFAVSASELISILEDSRLFKDVGFLSSINKTGDGKEQFSIGMKIE